MDKLIGIAGSAASELCVDGLRHGFIVQDCMINNKQYDGSEKKFGITVNGIDYLVKFKKRDWTNVLSEVIASNFINECGGLSHDVYLGEYNGDTVAICRDFTKQYGNLETIKSINSSSMDTDKENHEYYFDDVKYELSKIHGIDYESAVRSFILMYGFDSILGNTDRHMGNWGFCNKDGIQTFSPIFDNGASLFPRNKTYIIDEDWMKERIYTFPNSKLMFNDKRERSSYYQVWRSDILPEDIKSFFRSIPIKYKLVQTLADIPISDDLKNYYATVVYYRFNGIVNDKFEWEGILNWRTSI